MTTLLESPFLTLLHDPGCACLYATWQGQPDDHATQAEYEAILRCVSLTHSTKLLNDGLLDQNGWRELTSWIAQNCFQQLVGQGLLAVAWVLPRDPQALRDTQKHLATLKQPLVETFDDPEGAYRWLHQWPR